MHTDADVGFRVVPQSTTAQLKTLHAEGVLQRPYVDKTVVLGGKCTD
jgi:hypothetical protein